MANVIPIKSAREAPRSRQSKMETVYVTTEMVQSWRVPPFQRPLRINEKVRLCAEQIRQDGVIEGVLTLGRHKDTAALYIVDGQHRIEAFKLSGISEVLADIRVVNFETMADMADQFVLLQSSLVRMRPDDMLRGLEPSCPALALIRKSCEFVGYDNIRRTSTSPIVGMSMLLRCWICSAGETPTGAKGGCSVAQMAQEIDPGEVSNLIAFLATAHSAWGRDAEYARLWGGLNLTVCMWLWRRLVMERDRGIRRYVILNAMQFKQCLMALSASGNYLDWLIGRTLNDRDRSPCYGRIKSIFVKRLASDNSDKKPIMPAPPWAAK
jgi:hypothetical protein